MNLKNFLPLLWLNESLNRLITMSQIANSTYKQFLKIMLGKSLMKFAFYD